jgi:hypothetical protein
VRREPATVKSLAQPEGLRLVTAASDWLSHESAARPARRAAAAAAAVRTRVGALGPLVELMLGLGQAPGQRFLGRFRLGFKLLETVAGRAVGVKINFLTTNASQKQIIQSKRYDTKGQNQSVFQIFDIITSCLIFHDLFCPGICDSCI